MEKLVQVSAKPPESRLRGKSASNTVDRVNLITFKGVVLRCWGQMISRTEIETVHLICVDYRRAGDE